MGATKTFSIELGKSGRKSVSLDARPLLDTRLLITGDSGSGKSWLCRLIAEQNLPSPSHLRPRPLVPLTSG